MWGFRSLRHPLKLTEGAATSATSRARAFEHRSGMALASASSISLAAASSSSVALATPSATPALALSTPKLVFDLARTRTHASR